MSNKEWEYWNLESTQGRQIWRFTPPKSKEGEISWSTNQGKGFLENHEKAFLFDPANNANSADRVYREKSSFPYQEDNVHPVVGLEQILKNGISHFASLQADDGHWPGDYGGPMFLLPGLVIASYVTSTPLPEPHSTLIRRYMLNHQNPDGGWGLHIEGTSTMFGTVMQYVALRILGMGPDNPDVNLARDWIRKHGGATAIPSWGKFYLSLLGVYKWEGNNSLLPEMWLVPRSMPFHPGRYWCHCRMVYLPMSYCFGAKVVGPITDLIKELRQEIYTTSYDQIDWIRARNRCADEDRFTQSKPLLKKLLRLLNGYERIRSGGLRRRALKYALDYVQAEDDHTNYVDIGPVNKIINSICVWHAKGPQSAEFKSHVDRWFDYLWLAEDGMKMSGYNGSQLWDTAFAAQAILESPVGKKYGSTLAKAYQYLDVSQVQNEVRDPNKFFRHPSVGGWPFSTVDHGWPITDCTSEGLIASLQIANSGALTKNPISDKRLQQAADLLLSFQNSNGGWATYELTRGPAWLEGLNPSEVFGDIMVDYSYTECTSACIRSLAQFHQKFPHYQSDAIINAIKAGTRFIQSQQLKDGSWIGSWGVCFTYGTWFGVEGLVAVKSSGHLDASIQDQIERACDFLISKQNRDGGWGESYQSCVQKQYVPSESQIVNTSWALLTLMAANYPNIEPIQRGVQFLMDHQESNGDWPQEGISGVFNSNCMITYSNYRNIFPIWALGRYYKIHGEQHAP